MQFIDLTTGRIEEWDEYQVRERGLPDDGDWHALHEVSKETLAGLLRDALDGERVERCPRCGSDRVDETEWSFRAGTLGFQCRACGYSKNPGPPLEAAR